MNVTAMLSVNKLLTVISYALLTHLTSEVSMKEKREYKVENIFSNKNTIKVTISKTGTKAMIRECSEEKSNT